MKKFTLIKALSASLLIGSGVANAALIDLSTWEHDGNGTWATQGVNNDSVLQSINGQPTVFFENGSNARDTAISGNIQVGSTSDDDFVGFVLGYQNDELSSASADYWLVDWKQGNQSYGGSTALAGLALSHVTDGSVENYFWGHHTGIDEIARGSNLGSTGWVVGTTYSFDIIHTASLIQVKVDGNVELSVSATTAGVSEFNDGAYGFYNYSQNNVLYSGLEERVIITNSVPEPTSLAILSLGLIGFASRKFKK